ncbi:glycosyltransferase family 4 protein, partial [Chloroflexota bacterium]
MRIKVLTPIRKGGPLIWGRELVLMLKNNGIDAYHIHSLPSIIATQLYTNVDIIHAAVPFIPIIQKKPYILTIKGDYAKEQNIWRSFYPEAIKRADIITIPSYYLKYTLSLGNAIVIPNAINLEKYKTVSHRKRNIINLVTVTKFYFKAKAEGVQSIFDILANLSSEIRERIVYKVIGDGPYLCDVKKAANKLDFKVTFTGMVNEPHMEFKNSDVFLYYSYHDNFPNAILEAMACGIPVITNDIGAVKE